MAASILTAVALPDLITLTLEDYKTLAVMLARDSNKIQEVRNRLERNRLEEPLFDTPRFVKNLEKAYKEMWDICSVGAEPRQIEISED